MKKTILLPLISIILAAAVLLGMSFGLQGLTAKNTQAEHIQIMQTILPDSTTFVVEPYAGEDANIRSVHKADNGFVIETVTYGYASEITMLIGVSNEGKVTGLVVRDMAETFGLGGNALIDHVFLSQFLNGSEFAVADAEADAFSGATGSAEVSDSAVEVDAIAGATVTTKAIIRCVNSAVAYVTGADIESSATSWGG